MSLAHVVVSGAEVDDIYDHLVSYNPKYRNMHLRATYSGTPATLRYLHAMIAHDDEEQRIEGKISGPEGFWHYELTVVRGVGQIGVFDERASMSARSRMERVFLREIRVRINEEQKLKQAPHGFAPRRIRGELYLKRSSPGSLPSEPICQAAVSANVLDPTFVAALYPWDLELFRW